MKQILFKLFENLKQLGIKPNIGSRTNVTPIRGSEIDRLINRPVTPKEFDYSKPEVVDSMRGIVQNASDYVGQFTERQLKTFNDNVERILGVIKPKEITADVVDIATKEKITGPGLESLMKEKGVAPISRKTIEAETLIKQFLDDDLISLNAKQIDQLSRGKAEDVFENIFGSKAKELITGKNTNESLNEVYNKLKTTKDTRGRLPDDPNFDPSDINFKDGGSVSEDVKQLLKEEFIELINADPESFPDTNAGFRRFLKRKGSPVFNYKKGGKVEKEEEEQGPSEQEKIVSNEIDKFFNRIKIGGGFSNKDLNDPFNIYGFGKKDIKDPRIGIEVLQNPEDEKTARWGISIGPKGGGLTFVKPFSQIGLSGDWEEVPESWYEDNIPDVNVLIPELPEMKKGGKVGGKDKSKAEEPLSNYKSYSENELLSSLDAKMPNLEIVDDELVNMPMFEPRDVVPKGARPVMPSEEYFRQRLFLDLADGGEVKSFEEQSLNKKGYETKDLTKKEIFDLYDSVMGTFSKRYKKGGEVKKRKRYADGGFITMKDNGDFVVTYPSGSSSLYSGTANAEFLQNLISQGYSFSGQQGSTGMSTPTTTEIPTVDPFSGQPVSEQEIIDLNKQMNPPTPAAGYTEEGLRKIAEDEAARLQSMMEALNSGFYNNTPTVDPFSGQQVSAQEQAAFTQPQPEIFPTSNNIANTLNVGSSDPLTNILGSQVGNLSYSEMNALRNNPNAFLENPFLQALRTGVQSLSPGKVMSDVGEGLSNIYHGTTDPSKAFSGSKFFATPDYQTALQYAKEGALRGTSIGDTTGDILRATVPTSQVQDLLKRGLTGTREIVLDPQAAQKLFLQGSGDLVETGSLMSRLGRKSFQALPVVGAGLAGLDAYQRFGQGDYIGSALGAASAIPVLGLPATAAQVAYDIYNQSQNSPVVGFNQVQDPRTMMAYGGRVSMSNGGLTKTIPPVRGPNPQGVESLFKRRYN